MPLDATLAQYIIASLAALSVGLAKAGIAGLGIVAVPFMAEAFPARVSVGVLLPILICADILAISFYRRHAQWRIIFRLMPFTLAGIVAGFLLLGKVSDEHLKTAMGIVVLVLIGIRFLTRNIDVAQSKAGRFLGPIIGTAAGITTTMANAAGPLMVVYLLWMRVEKKQFIGTGAWFFFTVNCIKVPFLASLGLITSQTLLFDLTVVPFAITGALAGLFIVKRVNQKWFEIAVQILAIAGAMRLILA